MKTIEIASLQDYCQHVLTLCDSNCYYRGERLSSRSILAKIGRMQLVNQTNIAVDDEVEVLERFKNKAVLRIKEVPRTNLEWLMLAQHHGLATRLIDFSSNPLVALYFAVEKPMFESTDNSIVYIYRENCKASQRDEIIDPFNQNSNILINPKCINERMYLQQSRFLLVHSPTIPYEDSTMQKITILNHARREIKRQLNIFGINRMNLFDTLDAVAEFVEWGKFSKH